MDLFSIGALIILIVIAFFSIVGIYYIVIDIKEKNIRWALLWIFLEICDIIVFIAISRGAANV